MTDEQMRILRSPLPLDGKPLLPVDETGTVLKMELYEGLYFYIIRKATQ